MQIDLNKLRAFLDKSVKPRWKTRDNEWPFRPGGGELYIQEKVLAKGAPFLTENSIRQSAKESILNSLKSNENLLSQFETMFANVFTRNAVEEDLRKYLLDLLYGADELVPRLRRFLDWTRVEPVPGEKKKQGINATVVSYLLALSNPREYAYCKPSAYNAAVDQFLGKKERKTAPIDRLIHCNEFYKIALKLLESEYGLQNGNLFDVHSLFFFLYDETQKERTSAPPPVLPPPGVPAPALESPIYDKLLERHNLVLYGPPGTGKTREVYRFANSWKTEFGEESVTYVTFHPSYCYEDFIEGYRPNPQGDGFTLRDGLFKKLCSAASKVSDTKYLLIVDEINRGDVARILGETITLIEGDKRGEGFCVKLQQSGEQFCVPGNLYLLGTMNSADKSISLMDLAIRRRFLFFPCYPNPDVLDDSKAHVNEISGTRLSQVLIGINQRLMDAGIDRDRTLGHSYLLIRKDSANPFDALKDRFKYEIIPLLEEYFYADRSRLSAVLGDLVDDFGQANDDVLGDPERLLGAIRKLRMVE